MTPGANEDGSEDTARPIVNALRSRDGTNAAGSRERGHSAMRGLDRGIGAWKF